MRDIASRVRDLHREAEQLRKEIASVDRKRVRLARIETQLRRIATVLDTGGEDSLLDRPKSRHGFVNGKRAKPMQHGSSVWWTAKVLFMAGQQMHIDKVLERVQKESGTKFEKATVVSNLSRYVRHGDTFSRPAPNVFALLDFTKNPDPQDKGAWKFVEEEAVK